MYDVTIAGGRVSGSALALDLARAGLSVLVLDRARFPSDTLSTHQLQVPGVARLSALGVLDRVLASGAPPTRRIRFHAGSAVVDAAVPTVGGIDFMFSPRRTVLDAVLVDAVREAGAEVREGTSVEALLRDDGGRVTGVRTLDRSTGHESEVPSRLVVGADGRRSTVARLVGAREYDPRPAATVASYTYWDDFPFDGGEMHSGAGWVAAGWPTNDGQVLTYVARPIGDWDLVRRDPEAALLEVLDRAGTLGKRAREARMAGPVRSTNDTAATHREPGGPGWLLVGDAGLVIDPVTGLGMSHGLEDAARAVGTVRSLLGGGSETRALRAHRKERDAATAAAYSFTAGLTALRGVSPAEERLFEAISADPAEGTRFLAAIAGAEPTNRFFSPPNLIRLVGLRGFLALAKSRPR
jgi:2-polyprenyl-6-methoxyphenol hydroxylase-like FAD-dependent oxidoreductase